MLYWNPWAVTGLLSGSIVLALAFLVLMSAPNRLQNRALALLLAAEGSGIMMGTWFMYSVRDPTWSFAGQTYTVISMTLAIPAYLLLVSTLPTPLVRPLRHPAARALMWATVPLPFLFVWIWTDFFVQAPTLVSRFAPESLVASSGPGFFIVMLMMSALFVFGIVAAISAFRRAPEGSPLRQQSRLFAIAFGLRDGLFIANILLWGVVKYVVPDPAAWLRWFAGNTGVNIVEIVYAPVLAYGILKHQLFDIDLKIKWTIHRGTLAALFIAGFFVVSELVASVLSDRIGLVAGILMTGLLVFALAPLQRVAERLSDKAMPRVHDTQEYRMVRKRDVYLAALEGALVDGVVSDRERDMLARLQDQLGLSATEARELERTTAKPLTT